MTAQGRKGTNTGKLDRRHSVRCKARPALQRVSGLWRGLSPGLMLRSVYDRDRMEKASGAVTETPWSSFNDANVNVLWSAESSFYEGDT